jgi:hypothetical protein
MTFPFENSLEMSPLYAPLKTLLQRRFSPELIGDISKDFDTHRVQWSKSN